MSSLTAYVPVTQLPKWTIEFLAPGPDRYTKSTSVQFYGRKGPVSHSDTCLQEMAIWWIELFGINFLVEYIKYVTDAFVNMITRILDNQFPIIWF